MARASTRTLLPLDRWAFHLGLEPRHFNGVTTTAAPDRNCSNVWLQYAWQASDRVGREEVAEAIAQAEQDIITELGFYPLPQWTAGEVVHTVRPYDRSLSHNDSLQNGRGLYQSVKAGMGLLIAGGIKASTEIGTATVAGGTMVWTDLDGDGYDEIARITLATTVTDTDEIRCYFPSHDQEDEWEIRPLKAVSISGGNVVIDIERHLLVDPDLWEAIGAEAVDGDDDGNFLTSIEVYRVYHDPQQQAQLQWERIPNDCSCGSTDCAMCAWSVQWACLQTRNPRLGHATYQPGTWDATDEEFNAASLAVSRAPERVRLWYRSGWQWAQARRDMIEMDPLWERVITYYSVTLLDRPICDCNNVTAYIDKWRTDLAYVGSGENDGRWQMQIGGRPSRVLDCPWGTMQGAVWAWQQVQRRRIGKAVEL